MKPNNLHTANAATRTFTGHKNRNYQSNRIKRTFLLVILMLSVSVFGFSQTSCPKLISYVILTSDNNIRLAFQFQGSSSGNKSFELIALSSRGDTLVQQCHPNLMSSGVFYDTTNYFPNQAGINIITIGHVSDCNSNSCFTTTATPLPVQIVSFNVHVKSNQAQLYWQVAHEDIKNYVVERSFDGSVWAEIEKIDPQGSTYYSYTDNVNQNAFYRLKLVENNGTYSYSQTVMAKIAEPANVNFFPNPVTETLHLSTIAEYELYDLQGKQILKGTGTSVNMDVPSGTYLLKLGNNMHTVIKL